MWENRIQKLLKIRRQTYKEYSHELSNSSSNINEELIASNRFENKREKKASM